MDDSSNGRVVLGEVGLQKMLHTIIFAGKFYSAIFHYCSRVSKLAVVYKVLCFYIYIYYSLTIFYF